MIAHKQQPARRGRYQSRKVAAAAHAVRQSVIGNQHRRVRHRYARRYHADYRRRIRLGSADVRLRAEMARAIAVRVNGDIRHTDDKSQTARAVVDANRDMLRETIVARHHRYRRRRHDIQRRYRHRRRAVGEVVYGDGQCRAPRIQLIARHRYHRVRQCQGVRAADDCAPAVFAGVNIRGNVAHRYQRRKVARHIGGDDDIGDKPAREVQAAQSCHRPDCQCRRVKPVSRIINDIIRRRRQCLNFISRH